MHVLTLSMDAINVNGRGTHITIHLGITIIGLLGTYASIINVLWAHAIINHHGSIELRICCVRI